MWTLRTARKGSIALLQDYKKVILIKLLDIDEPIGSGKMYHHLVEKMKGNHPSRASMIFFLNALVDNKYCKFNDGTGKGGHHKLYYTELSTVQFIEKIIKDINTTLDQALSIVFD